MEQNSKTQKKVLKVLLSRNPNCSTGTSYFPLRESVPFLLLSLFSGYFLYYCLPSVSQEKIRYWIKKAKSVALILLGPPLLVYILVRICVKITPLESHFETFLGILFFTFFNVLFIPLSILFGFCFGIFFWYLKFFENHPKAKFVLFPILIWLGMLLYTIVLLLLLTFIGLF